MKKIRIITSIFALMLFVCLFGVEGQYQYYTPPQTEVIGQTTPYQPEAIGQALQYPSTSSGYQAVTPTTTPVAVSQNSQYYTVGATPSTHVSAPQQVDLTGKLPNSVYFGYQQQAVPFAQYKTDPAFTEGNTLWILGPSWIQNIKVPVGASLSLLAISPTGGSGYVNELDPNGRTNTYNYYFYPTSTLGFYADSPGRHVVSFVIGGRSSNQVVIDVEGAYTAPSYYRPSSYYGYYPYNGWDWGPWWGWGGFGFGGENEAAEGSRTVETGEGISGGTGGGISGGTGGGISGGTSGGGGESVEHGESGEQHGEAGEQHGMEGLHGEGAEHSRR